MKNIKFFVLAVALIMLLALAACSESPTQGDINAPPSRSSGQIYLYGEQHGIDKILDKEFKLWYEYYHNEYMRHLFVELPYYTAEFLNMWMQSESDDILEQIYSDWVGTASHNSYIKEFYKKIKSECPETVFHGTDVGHQYKTTGKRFLRHLENYNLEGSEQYLLAQEAIEQGKYYYEHTKDVYRENKMTENFIREFDNLSGEKAMGIYGGAHTGLDAMDYTTRSVPCMAKQLKERYGDAVHSEDLTWLAKDIDPYRVDIIKVNEKDYEASYFAKQDLTGAKDYDYREFWRLENAYDDFKNNSKTGDVLPYNNYPMLIETGQVFVIDYTKKDSSVIRKYYRSDGYVWNGMPSTEEFTAK
jgi:hypothetical protein